MPTVHLCVSLQHSCIICQQSALWGMIFTISVETIIGLMHLSVAFILTSAFTFGFYPSSFKVVKIIIMNIRYML